MWSKSAAYASKKARAPPSAPGALECEDPAVISAGDVYHLCCAESGEMAIAARGRSRTPCGLRRRQVLGAPGRRRAGLVGRGGAATIRLRVLDRQRPRGRGAAGRAALEARARGRRTASTRPA